MSNPNPSNEVPRPVARYGTVQKFLETYPLSRARTYRLLSEGRIRAKKLEGRTLIDFTSADELLANLPDYERAA